MSGITKAQTKLGQAMRAGRLELGYSQDEFATSVDYIGLTTERWNAVREISLSTTS